MPTMRRRVTASLVATLAFMSIASPALAHASFDKSQVPAEAEVDLTFNAPQERASTNARIEALAPRQFTILACTAPDGWTCQLDTVSSAPNTVIIWQVGSAAIVPVSAFPMLVRTPDNDEQGVYAWPVIQTYADDFEAEWIGEASPTVQVGDSDAPVIENSEQPQSHGKPTPEPSGAATNEPDDATESGAPSEPGASASANPTDAATTTASDADNATSTDEDATVIDATSTSSDNSAGADGGAQEVGESAAITLADVEAERGRPVGMIVAVMALALSGAVAFGVRGRWSRAKG